MVKLTKKVLLITVLIMAILLNGCDRSGDTGSQVTSSASSSTKVENAINNDTIWLDTNNEVIYAQGGCIYREGDTFHWFGPQFGVGTDYKFYAVNHYTSTDLVNWKKESPAFTPETEGIPFNRNTWVGRPWVLYNAPTQKYVMIIEGNTSNPEGVRVTYNFLTADSLYGPWTFVGDVKRLPDATGETYSLGDLGAFQDDDGNAYIMYTFDKGGTNKTQGIAKLDPASYTRVLTPEEGGFMAEFTGEAREAASIFKKDGIYYYFTSKCMGWESSQTKYRTAESMEGPWSPAKPVRTIPYSVDSYNTQHDFVLTIVGSKTTSYIYCGDRWSNYTKKGIGRNAWFPLEFDDSGPIIRGYKSWSINIETGEIEEK